MPAPTPEPQPLRGKHLAPARGLGVRFHSLYAGTAVSLLGNYVAYLTIPLLVLEVVGSAESAMPFSLTYALETIPTLVFGLVGGVLLDRVRLRWAMILADIARAGAFFYLASSVGTLDLASVLAAAFLIGSFSAVYENALYAILPAIVTQENLARANGRIAATQAAMFATGPLLAGAMAAFAGPAPGLWFNGATFLVSAVGVYLVGPVGRIAPQAERSGFVEDTLDGLRFLFGERRLRDSTIAAAAANLVFGFFEGTFVVLAKVVLGATSEFQIGLLIVSVGVGSIIGAAFAARVIRRLGLGRTMIIGLGIMATGWAMLVFSRFGLVALSIAVFMFLGIGLVNVPIATIRQIYTPAAMLGRVITASRALSWGTLPVGALLGGLLAARLSYIPTVRATPLLLVAATLWLLTTPLYSDTFGPTYEASGKGGDDSPQGEDREAEGEQVAWSQRRRKT